MIGCLFLSIDQSSCPGHLILPPFYYFQRQFFLRLLTFRTYEKIFIVKHKEAVPNIFSHLPFFSPFRPCVSVCVCLPCGMRSLFLRGGYSFPSSPSEFHSLPPSQLRRFCPSAFSLSPFAFYLSVARPPTYPLKA